MSKERFIDLQLIKPIQPGTPAIKGKISLKTLFKEFLKSLGVGFKDPCCDDPATCPPISSDSNNAIECRGGGLYVDGIANSVTADNGLNISSPNNVQLGGTLLSDTAVNTTVNHSLSVLGDVLSSSKDGTLIVKNLSLTGSAIYAQATSGTAINSTSNGGVSVIGTDSSFGIGIRGSTISGTAVYATATSGRAGDFLISPSSTNTLANVLSIERLSSGTAQNNIGAYINYLVATTSGGATESTQLISKWTDATFATRTSQFIIAGVNNAITADLLTINGNGSIKGNKYGLGTFTGTPTYTLQVDSSGNIIEGNTPNITSGVIAPSSTPTKVGNIYIDTSAKKLYFAAGTSSSADWIIAN